MKKNKSITEFIKERNNFEAAFKYYKNTYEKLMLQARYIIANINDIEKTICHTYLDFGFVYEGGYNAIPATFKMTEIPTILEKVKDSDKDLYTPMLESEWYRIMFKRVKEISK